MKLRIENEAQKRIPNERRWYVCKIHEVTQVKYEIVELLSLKYSVKSLCEIMKVSRSGYYKWLNNKDILNNHEKTERIWRIN